MLCESCNKKEATIFIKENFFGEARTHSFCESCAKAYRSQMVAYKSEYAEINALVEDILNKVTRIDIEKMIDKDEEQKEKIRVKTRKLSREKRCVRCGSTYDDVIIGATPGCMDCYTCFEKEIFEYVTKVSRDSEYIGKIPKSFKADRKVAGDANEAGSNTENSSVAADKEKLEMYKSTIRKYKVRLNAAIKAEDFDSAAKARDIIREQEMKIKELSDKMIKRKKKNKSDNNK